MFADYITQIITLNKSIETKHYNRTLAQNTQIEFEKQNQYEIKWKIKTNMNKFSVVPVFRRNAYHLIMENKRIEY